MRVSGLNLFWFVEPNSIVPGSHTTLCLSSHMTVFFLASVTCHFSRRLLIPHSLSIASSFSPILNTHLIKSIPPSFAHPLTLYSPPIPALTLCPSTSPHPRTHPLTHIINPSPSSLSSSPPPSPTRTHARTQARMTDDHRRGELERKDGELRTSQALRSLEVERRADNERNNDQV